MTVKAATAPRAPVPARPPIVSTVTMQGYLQHLAEQEAEHARAQSLHMASIFEPQPGQAPTPTAARPRKVNVYESPSKAKYELERARARQFALTLSGGKRDAHMQEEEEKLPEPNALAFVNMRYAQTKVKPNNLNAAFFQDLESGEDPGSQTENRSVASVIGMNRTQAPTTEAPVQQASVQYGGSVNSRVDNQLEANAGDDLW